MKKGIKVFVLVFLIIISVRFVLGACGGAQNYIINVITPSGSTIASPYDCSNSVWTTAGGGESCTSDNACSFSFPMPANCGELGVYKTRCTGSHDCPADAGFYDCTLCGAAKVVYQRGFPGGNPGGGNWGIQWAGGGEFCCPDSINYQVDATGTCVAAQAYANPDDYHAIATGYSGNDQWATPIKWGYGPPNPTSWLDCDRGDGATFCSILCGTRIRAGELPVGEYPDTSISHCCGDDAGEYFSDCRHADYWGPNDVAFCPTSERCCNAADCVDASGNCRSGTNDLANFGNLAYFHNNLNPGGDDDWSFCYSADDGSYGTWLDCDSEGWFTSWCANAGVCGDTSGVLAGESGVGEYTNQVTLECCGDDAGEYYIETDGWIWRCCDNPTDCVQAGGSCYDDSSCVGSTWLCGGTAGQNDWVDCAARTTTDTDSGNDPTNAGTVTDWTTCTNGVGDCNYVNHADVCASAIQLIEYYPSGSGFRSEVHTCYGEQAATGTNDNNNVQQCRGGRATICSGGEFNYGYPADRWDGCINSANCFSQGGAGGGNCLFREYYPGNSDSCSGLESCVSTNYDPDTNSNTCNACVGGSGAWTGRGGSLNCCGDDANEARPYQATESSCSDGNDNDCDGLIDSADPDCCACLSGSCCDGCDIRPNNYLCNSGWACTNNDWADNAYSNGGFEYSTQGYCDGFNANGCDRSGGERNADTNLAACECEASGTQSTCSNGEVDCWDNSAAQCCGDDGSGDDWCAGAYTACVDGTFRTSGDSYSAVCSCGGGTWTGRGGSLNCCGDDANEAGPYEATETSCSDGRDNDCDGLIDSADPDCCACSSGTCCDGCDIRPNNYLCNSGWACTNNDWADNAYSNGGFEYSTQGYCDGFNANGCDRSGGERNADTNLAACECEASGTQSTCSNGEVDCWDNSAAQCCGDDGTGDDWCAGGYTACVDGTFRTIGNAYSAVCSCGGGTWTGGGGSLNCCGDNLNEGSPYEATESSCSDGNDNDCDGLIDSADPDCCVCSSGTCCDGCDIRPNSYLCNSGWACTNNDWADNAYSNGGFEYSTQGYCDGFNANGCDRSGGGRNADNSLAACECEASGTQSTCSNGEVDCWDNSAAQCCGDDGSGDDWCAGAYTACVDGTFRTSADGYSAVCSCGGGAWLGSSCCGDDANEGSPYQNPETSCWDTNDNNCDGRCDYDTQGGCVRGDVNCPVGISDISASDYSPPESSSITVYCTSTVSGVDSIWAEVVGVGDCSFDYVWSGPGNLVAEFSCQTGDNSGTCPRSRQIRCYVNGNSEPATGLEEQTDSINVACSSCLGYSDETNCNNAPGLCEWCVECNPASPRQENGQGGDVCVNQGTCNGLYRCWTNGLNHCSALCDASWGGCGVGETCLDPGDCTCEGFACDPDLIGDSRCCDNTHPTLNPVEGVFGVSEPPTDFNDGSCGGGSCYDVGFPDGGGDYNGVCCQDDNNEYFNQRTCLNSGSSGSRGHFCDTNSGDTACCNLNDDCIYNGQCYPSDGSAFNFIGDNEADAVCEDMGSTGRWVDCDENSGWCDDCDQATDLLGCAGVGCFILTGEQSSHGEYSPGQTECCGDDSSEYVIIGGQTRCCGSQTDCVGNDGICRAPAVESIANDNCQDSIDNNCDGECDYDDREAQCTRGDPGCPVEVNDIRTANDHPVQGSTIVVECNSTVFGAQSIDAYVDLDICTWTGWNGDWAQFDCDVGNALTCPDAKQIRCTVNSESYSYSGDVASTIYVEEINCGCHGVGTCENNPNCDWCPECNANNEWNALGPDQCVTAGSCSYNCNMGPCGATCDSGGGCGDGFECNSTCQCSQTGCDPDESGNALCCDNNAGPLVPNVNVDRLIPDFDDNCNGGSCYSVGFPDMGSPLDYNDLCCQDDFDEFFNQRTCLDSGSSGSSGHFCDSSSADTACCDLDDDCIYNNQCYPSDNTAFDFISGGAPDVVCEDMGTWGRWVDCDENSGRCTDCDNTAPGLPNCAGIGCYLTTGEIIGHGEYTPGQQECCGDDANEFPTALGPGATRCCNNAGECVDQGNSCQDNVAESPANFNCQDGFDNDCDNSCDYDGATCAVGDPGCPVSVTGMQVSVTDTTPMENSNIQVNCSYSVANVDSALAQIDGVGDCDPPVWFGSKAIFNCFVGDNGPSCPMARNAICTVGPTSTKSGGDWIVPLSIQCTDCSGYGGQATCVVNPTCQWCLACSGFQYSGGIDRCMLASSSCSYSCVEPNCGAGCDNGECGVLETCNMGTCQCDVTSCDPDAGQNCCDDNEPGQTPDYQTDNGPESFAMQCAGASCYDVGFPDSIVAGTYDDLCCQDDSGENYEQCARDGSISWLCEGTDACCDSNSCVYEDDCFDAGDCHILPPPIAGGNDERAYCLASSSWDDADTDITGNECSACGFNMLPGGASVGFGEYGGGETECCGDDNGENEISAGVGITMCCDDASVCVDGTDNCRDGSVVCDFNYIDEDCDGETDWDNWDGLHGDFSCQIGVGNPVISNPTPVELSSIVVDCPTLPVAAVGSNSVDAHIDGDFDACNFNSWNGNSASFDCNVGLADSGCPTTKTVTCTINTSRSHNLTGDTTDTIQVGCSDCTRYSGAIACNNAPAGCEYCQDCSGVLSNGIGPDTCVSLGECNYACWQGYCEAACDQEGGCGSGSCNAVLCTCDSMSCDPDEYGNANCCNEKAGLIPDINITRPISNFNLGSCDAVSCYGVGWPIVPQVKNVYFESCCGDDLGETYTTCNADLSIAWACDTLDACCDDPTSCQYGDSCYYDTNCPNLIGSGNDTRAYCSGASWTDPDFAPGNCQDCSLNWAVSGEENVGEYASLGANACCGDDDYEVIETCSIESAEMATRSCDATSVCCRGASCAVNNICIPLNNCSQIWGTGLDQYGYCLASGSLTDPDTPPSTRCTAACGLNWVNGGELSGFGEYSTGSELECCGDDANEFYNYYNQISVDGCDDILDNNCIGVNDDLTDNACCNDTTDCVYGDSCYARGEAIDLRLPIGPDAYCGQIAGLTWIDCDNDLNPCQNVCGYAWLPSGEAGVGEYNLAGISECCGDDVSENSRYREVLSYSTGTNHLVVSTDFGDTACCQSQFACVFNRNCYMDRTVAIVEINLSCNSISAEGACNADTDCAWQSRCQRVRGPRSYNCGIHTTSSECISDNRCDWFGDCTIKSSDYSNTPSIWDSTYRDKVFFDINSDGRLEVCDPGEWIDPNTDQLLCEDMGGIWLGSVCCGDITQDPDCEATFYGNVQDIDDVNINNAEVTLLGTSNLDPTKTYNYTAYTDINGNYTVQVIGNASYDLVASKSYYLSDTVINQFVEMTYSKEVNFTLISSYEQCEADCTFTDDDYCHAGCDGRVGCLFNSTETKNICTGKVSGWVVKFNDSHDVICCEGASFKKRRFRVIGVNVGPEIENLVRLIRVVILRGKPTKMIIDTFM